MWESRGSVGQCKYTKKSEYGHARAKKKFPDFPIGGK